MSHAATSSHFKENAKAALADHELQTALTIRRGEFHRAAPGRCRPAARSSRRCATRPATSRTTRSRISTSTSKPTSGSVSEAGGQVHCAVTAEDARADHARHLPQRRRPDRHQGQDDGRRRRSASTIFSRGKRHHAGRDRSRRIHHPAPPRSALATSSRPRCISRRSRSRPISAACTRDLPADRDLVEPASLLAEARAVLRQKFLAADVGITGANFLVAETGTLGHRHQRGQRRSHPDAAQGPHRARHRSRSWCRRWRTWRRLLRLLARSATGQDMSVYTTLSTGPRRAGDPDGPGEYHVVLLDNGRSAMLGRRVPGHAALHPLRRLHEPLPGLSRGRRPRLRLGLSRPDGRGADAEPDRHRQGRPPAQRVDLLRPLRGGLPGAHSAAAA